MYEVGTYTVLCSYDRQETLEALVFLSQTKYLDIFWTFCRYQIFIKKSL